MMVKYALLGDQGMPEGFFSDDVHGPRLIDGEPNHDTLIPTDAIELTDDQWLEFINNNGLRKWVDGQVVVYEPPQLPPAVPDRISSRQFFLQLDKMDKTTTPGIYASVEGWVAAQDRSVRVAFDKSATFFRTDEMLQGGFTALGFTDQQVDNFFQNASIL